MGNIVRVYCGECVPADLLILTCGHSESAILDLRMVDGATSFTRRASPLHHLCVVYVKANRNSVLFASPLPVSCLGGRFFLSVYCPQAVLRKRNEGRLFARGPCRVKGAGCV